MATKTLFITPPFTQLNTPYPATSYLTGFFNSQNLPVSQIDLGIEVILELFSKNGLSQLFKTIDEGDYEIDDNEWRMFELRESYINTIEPTISFLQDTNPTLAHSICNGNYLPEASRFDQVSDLEWAFGTMGLRDKARHLATLYLEDISDLISKTVDPYFGFSRYAERLGRSATSFTPLYNTLQQELSFTDKALVKLLESKITTDQPDLIAISVPFPGNLYSAFRCAQFIKINFPEKKISLGGGFPNTELRSIKDKRVFDFFDFITLDDGERPLLSLIDYLEGNRKQKALKRTFCLNSSNEVEYFDNKLEKDFNINETGVPSHEGLPINKYLSVIEIANPMHRLWSDGRWNKLTLAHGCYWKKCSFCDISLDYIENYSPADVASICDKIEKTIAETGQNGFHFVDEAAPPFLMRDVAIEIIRRNLTVVWWTNIRFEKNFTEDLCKVLSQSGCIAVSGGLEVASNRLLSLMKKGVTVEQVAQVTNHFTKSGIMVHAYLMYGFPTQSDQETIDSLEMVRQLFEAGIIQSGFWHQFAMTSHSPVGLDPEAFGVIKTGPALGDFANNDNYHDDPTGAQHEQYSEGLKKSLFNYMHGNCFDFELEEWFDFKTPRTSIPKNFIKNALKQKEKPKQNAKIIWTQALPTATFFKDENGEACLLEFNSKTSHFQLTLDKKLGEWLFELLNNISIKDTSHQLTLSQIESDFEESELGSFIDLKNSTIWSDLKNNGLLIL